MEGQSSRRGNTIVPFTPPPGGERNPEPDIRHSRERQLEGSSRGRGVGGTEHHHAQLGLKRGSGLGNKEGEAPGKSSAVAAGGLFLGAYPPLSIHT